MATPFTPEELAAFRNVKHELNSVEGHEAISDREVVIFTLISKLRVDKAIGKCKDYLKILSDYSVQPKCLDPEDKTFDLTNCRQFLDNYRVCGRDKAGRSAMWIQGSEKGVEPKDEGLVVQAGTLYYLAVHSDLVSLREGITFVIDTSKSPAKPKGNERKLQKTWQSYPLRPQNIFIVGASWLKKIFINGLIKFASLFTKNKVIDRISFVGMDVVRKHFDEENMPHCHGGAEKPAVEEWVLSRLAAFRKLVPDLSAPAPAPAPPAAHDEDTLQLSGAVKNMSVV